MDKTVYNGKHSICGVDDLNNKKRKKKENNT
jgi:hypothetical protein